MTDLEKLENYKKGLAVTNQELELEKDFHEKHGVYCMANKEYMDKLKSNALWYKKEISFLEKEIYSNENLEDLCISELSKWAKSTEREPSSALMAALEMYFKRFFEECGANPKMKKEQEEGYRELILDKLIVGCIRSCSSEELRKLDEAKSLICKIE